MAPSPILIGLILNSCNGPQNSDLWQGVMHAAAELDIHVMTFTRGQYNSGAYRNEAVYKLPRTKKLDGLILSCTLPVFIDKPQNGLYIRRRFLSSFSDVPVVSYGAVDADVPGILVDNQQGTREAVRHLVLHHGYQRIAFVAGRGNYHDKQVRCQAYQAVLRENNLPIDPNLIVTPEEWLDEFRALDKLFNESVHPPEAIVASNDQTALSLINALQERGLRVPADVAVVGFDDIEQSSIVTPPLTTVSLRAFARGQQAVETLYGMITGEQVSGNIYLPTQLVIRESCGCLTPAIRNAAASCSNDQLSEVPDSRLRDLKSTLVALDLPESLGQRFVDSVYRELDGTPDFLDTLEEVLRRTQVDPLVLHDAISAIRQALLPFSDNRDYMENLWQQARVMIGERTRRGLAYRNWLSQEHDVRLARFGQLLNAQPGLNRMMHLLVKQLAYLGIPRCQVVLYNDPLKPTEGARVLLDYHDGEARIDADKMCSTGDVWPDSCDLTSHLVVEPLSFQNEAFGFVLFELGPRDDRLYDELARLLGSAVNAAMLVERNRKLYEEALEANIDKSRFLSMVSHEIRTPLTLLIGLSEMLSHDDGTPLPENYREDMTRIHMSARQLDGLMRDVMDLAHSQVGQLKILKKPLNLGDVLQAASVAGELMCQSKGLSWHYDVPGELPTILGDQTRLQQVIFNLVNNAVKYTHEGYIRLHVELARDEVKVLVTDTGIGIPESEYQTIFNEFQQSSTTRGFGGLGLGLAICRHLIELHGGTIGIHDSSHSSGSTFYFTLPTVADSLHRSPESRLKTVLLLTEEPDRIARLTDYLTGRGFTVECIQTSPEDFTRAPVWLENIFAFPPGALILDVQEDTAWVWDLMSSLKQDRSTQDLPVLFCSFNQEHGSMINFESLTKPIEGSALANALERFKLDVGDTNRQAILLVDDNSHIRDLHAAVVRRQIPEASILHAANGYEALHVMQQMDVNLVLLDLMMPELDGFAVLEKMQTSDKLRYIPVIVITAQSLTEDDMTRLNRGVTSVLSKGVFSTEETLWHIGRALENVRYGNSDAQQLVRMAIAYIHQHFHETLNRSDIARHSGVSDGHLTRCFRSELGITPITYLNRYRIEQAKYLLNTSHNNITEIASAVGFADSAYFARVFRREVGVSPSEYQGLHEMS